MSGSIVADQGLVMDSIPSDTVILTSSDGSPNGEGQASLEGSYQHLENHVTLDIIREESKPGETLGKVWFARVGMGLVLNTIGHGVLDDNQATVAVAWQRYALLFDPHHLAICRHIASLVSMDDLTVWTLDIALTGLVLYYLD